MSKEKEVPKVEIPKDVKQQPQPQQEMTEDQALMVYINQLVSNTILEHENAKTVAVESIKGMSQKLIYYVREVQRLTEENKKLKEKSEKK